MNKTLSLEHKICGLHACSLKPWNTIDQRYRTKEGKKGYANGLRCILTLQTIARNHKPTPLPEELFEQYLKKEGKA